MPEPFKNLFNYNMCENFAGEIFQTDKNFDKDNFLVQIKNPQFDLLELKERMDFITRALYQNLSKNYKNDISLLIKVSQDKQGFFYIVLSHYVELYGLDEFEVSIMALKEFTKLCSSEFAVRPFILKHKEKMIEEMIKWSLDSNEHVRRLASEGTRPTLPWGIDIPFLKENPDIIIPILRNLINDDSEYVRKSVANNLNSISKFQPEFVISFVRENNNKNKNTDKLLKHGLRTLLKEGNKEAIELAGYVKGHFKIENFEVDSSIKTGDYLNFSFNITTSDSFGKVRIEYIIDLLRQGNKYYRKIFKLSEFNFNTKEKKVIKAHSFKKVTTRTYYPGLHYITIVINGIEYEKKEFILEE